MIFFKQMAGLNVIKQADHERLLNKHYTAYNFLIASFILQLRKKKYFYHNQSFKVNPEPKL